MNEFTTEAPAKVPNEGDGVGFIPLLVQEGLGVVAYNSSI
jgi:hypothetical protein